MNREVPDYNTFEYWSDYARLGHCIFKVVILSHGIDCLGPVFGAYIRGNEPPTASSQIHTFVIFCIKSVFVLEADHTVLNSLPS